MATRDKNSNPAIAGRPLTARAVAELCGVELKTVHNWAAEGLLAHFRTPGRHLRFFPEAVQAFLRECGHRPDAESRPDVVCVRGPRGARLEKLLERTSVVWVPDLEGALIQCGRRAPDVLLVDAPRLTVRALVVSLKAVKRELPDVSIGVLHAAAAPKAAVAAGIVWGGLADVKRLLGS